MNQNHKLALQVTQSRSSCLLLSWVLKSALDGLSLPADERRQMEIFEGMSVLLKNTAKTLSEVNDTLTMS